MTVTVLVMFPCNLSTTGVPHALKSRWKIGLVAPPSRTASAKLLQADLSQVKSPVKRALKSASLRFPFLQTLGSNVDVFQIVIVHHLLVLVPRPMFAPALVGHHLYPRHKMIVVRTTDQVLIAVRQHRSQVIVFFPRDGHPHRPLLFVLLFPSPVWVLSRTSLGQPSSHLHLLTVLWHVTFEHLVVPSLVNDLGAHTAPTTEAMCLMTDGVILWTWTCHRATATAVLCRTIDLFLPRQLLT